MEVGERGAMRNTDNRYVWRPFGQQLVHARFALLIQMPWLHTGGLSPKV